MNGDDSQEDQHEIFVLDFADILRDVELTECVDFSDVLTNDELGDGKDLRDLVQAVKQQDLCNKDMLGNAIGEQGSLTMPFKYFKDYVKDMIKNCLEHCKMVIRSDNKSQIGILYANIEKLEKIGYMGMKLCEPDVADAEALIACVSLIDSLCTVSLTENLPELEGILQLPNREN